MNAKLKDVLGRAENWPDWAQEHVAEFLLSFEQELREPYQATPEELEGIDRGLRDAAEGRFASEEEVEAVFAKYRRS